MCCPGAEVCRALARAHGRSQLSYSIVYSVANKTMLRQADLRDDVRRRVHEHLCTPSCTQHTGSQAITAVSEPGSPRLQLHTFGVCFLWVSHHLQVEHAPCCFSCSSSICSAYARSQSCLMTASLQGLSLCRTCSACVLTRASTGRRP